MAKVASEISNNFCPQTLFLYGTYKEDGTPNFGLFCWISYCFDGGLKVMACIGGEKLTKDRIRETGVFSANLVTENILPLADYMGCREGYSADKMNVPVAVERGRALDVPILADSPVAFELEVARTVKLDDGDVFICAIKNVLHEEGLDAKDADIAEIMRKVAPVRSVNQTYFGWNGEPLGAWGEPQSRFNKE